MHQIERSFISTFDKPIDPSNKILGGKGAGLAVMASLGIPVPPGFTITTEAYSQYRSTDGLPDGIWDQTRAALVNLEEKTGQRLGGTPAPLLVSVRSGARDSMPGMMDTVLNVGLNDETVLSLAEQTKDSRFAYDSYRRLLQMYGQTVMGVSKEAFDHILDEIKQSQGVQSDSDLNTDSLQQVVKGFKEIIRTQSGEEFPQDPYDQLKQAITAVFRSWDSERAIAYRNKNGISHELGTAVTIQRMVFGNAGENSGTGVFFTRNPATGEQKIQGDFLSNAQGEDVVAGTRTTETIDYLAGLMPEVFQQLEEMAKVLETHFGDMQDIEFTVENGKLWLLQTRSGKRSAEAAVRIAIEMVGEGQISKEQAIMRVTPDQIQQLLAPQFDEKAKQQAIAENRLLTTGMSASPGAAVGEVVFDSERGRRRALELEKEGKKIILVRPETLAEDYPVMSISGGILTARGGKTSHAAVVARGEGIPAIVGASDIVIDSVKREMTINGTVIKEGDLISFDGTTGEVFLGEIPKGDKKSLSELPELAQILEWADEVATLQVWANAEDPKLAKQARLAGAKGIGLCRTEHMFFGERLDIFRQTILAADDARKFVAIQTALDNDRDTVISADELIRLGKAHTTFNESLKQLLEFQRSDFRQILQEMDGLPVVIRLLDPPLNEFLPDYTDLRVEIAVARANGVSEAEIAEKNAMLVAVENHIESNPMLGLRGVRLGIMYPEIYQTQVRAIIEAAAEVKRAGGDPQPKIMIPLVMDVQELRHMKEILGPVIEQVFVEQGVKIPYEFGTMIETPLAALTADDIAKVAEFFSIGSNDLTQMTRGLSRDDTARLLQRYIYEHILEKNPFQTVDEKGVGKLIGMAINAGRDTKPNLSIGVCGEHGGDPESITVFHKLGANYVSCSPQRIPIARLAAGQAAIATRGLSGNSE